MRGEVCMYIVVIVIMMVGLWAMIAMKNLIKKCIGMAIFQTGIILFYISIIKSLKYDINRALVEVKNRLSI